MATTTIRLDLAMMKEAFEVFYRLGPEMRRVKGLFFLIIMQCVQPEWANKGSPNVLGLENVKEPLVIINSLIKWSSAEDDELARKILRRMYEQIEAVAAARGAGHPFRYMNYCAEWQRPFDGCGDEALEFMRERRRKYDPEGLFRVACTGGFKLP